MKKQSRKYIARSYKTTTDEELALTLNTTSKAIRTYRRSNGLWRDGEEATHKRTRRLILLGGLATATELTLESQGLGLTSLLQDKPTAPDVKAETSDLTAHLDYVPTFLDVKTAIKTDDPNQHRIAQTYLDSLITERHTHDTGIPSWDSIRAFNYDPRLKTVKERFAVQGKTMRKTNEAYQDPTKGVALAVTTDLDVRKRATVYVNKEAFLLCKTQDELLSIFDNEAYHAGFYHKQSIHFPFKPYLKDKDVIGITHELFSFDLQLLNIHLGKRHVSTELMDATKRSAKILMTELETIAREHSSRAQEAQAVLAALKKRPTNYFFSQ